MLYHTMRLVFDVCILAVLASVVEGFIPVRNGGQIERQRTSAARFVAMSPLDNWSDDEEDEWDYAIEPLSTNKMISPISPGVVISCTLALAAAAMAWFSNDMHVIVGTGATVLVTGGAVAALTAASSGLSDNALKDADALESESLASTFQKASFDPVEQSSPGAAGCSDSLTNAQNTMASTVASESARNQESSSTHLAREWQQNQAVERLNMKKEFAPLELADSGASNDGSVRDAANDSFNGRFTPATASALYSSASTQLDAAPVSLATKIERLKVELELAKEWQETNMSIIKPAPPVHNGYQPVADPLNDLKPPSVMSGPPKFPDPPIISTCSPSFPSGKGSSGSKEEIANKLKIELDLAHEFFDDA